MTSLVAAKEFEAASKTTARREDVLFHRMLELDMFHVVYGDSSYVGKAVVDFGSNRVIRRGEQQVCGFRRLPLQEACSRFPHAPASATWTCGAHRHHNKAFIPNPV